MEECEAVDKLGGKVSPFGLSNDRVKHILCREVKSRCIARTYGVRFQAQRYSFENEAGLRKLIAVKGNKVVGSVG